MYGWVPAFYKVVMFLCVCVCGGDGGDTVVKQRKVLNNFSKPFSRKTDLTEKLKTR